MTSLKVKDSDERIELNNVFCVGRNYVDHINELKDVNMGSDIPKEPVIFLKPNSAVVQDDIHCTIPEFNNKLISSQLQNEVELVIVMGKDAFRIKENDAEEYIYGYAVGIDLTLRDVQTKLKNKGLPWTLSKGFINSAPISYICKKEHIKDPAGLSITLKVNNETRQDSDTGKMIFKIPYIVHYISHIYGLKKGDIIFTGTPSGISDLKPGDIVEAEISDVGKLTVNVV